MRVFSTRWPMVAMSVGSMVVTGRFFDRFEPAEKAAILAHEEGHIYHRHAWMRFKWIFTGNWKHLLYKCRLQEFEADAFAVNLGHAAGLMAFLQLSRAPEGPLHPSSDDRIEIITRLGRYS